MLLQFILTFVNQEGLAKIMCIPFTKKKKKKNVKVF